LTQSALTIFRIEYKWLILDHVLDMTSNSKVCLTLDAQIIENYLKICLENNDTVCLTISLSSSYACVLFLRSCLSNFHAECRCMASDWAKEHATKEDTLFDPQKCYKGGHLVSG